MILDVVVADSSMGIHRESEQDGHDTVRRAIYIIYHIQGDERYNLTYYTLPYSIKPRYMGGPWTVLAATHARTHDDDTRHFTLIKSINHSYLLPHILRPCAWCIDYILYISTHLEAT